MNREISFGALDEIRFQLHCSIETAFAVHECIESGSFPPSNYADALFGVCQHLYSIEKGLSAVIGGTDGQGRKTEKEARK